MSDPGPHPQAPSPQPSVSAGAADPGRPPRAPQGPRLFSRDDLSGFWALLADNLANMVIIAALLVGVVGLPAPVVFDRVLPGLGVALLAGLGVYVYLAHRLARMERRADVTALPYGISTPVLFVYVFGVMLPVKIATGDPLVAWQVGIAAALLGGCIEAAGSLIGPWLQRVTPRAGMLGTLAGIALVWIAVVPMAEIAEHPVVGLPALAVILVGLVARQRLPWGVPAGLAAILLGTGIFAAEHWLRGRAVMVDTAGLGLHLPGLALGDLATGLGYIAHHPQVLLIVLPIEIYNFIETMNNVESAAAAGDRYDVRVCQLADGGGTALGALFGSPFPTTVYIGHPAYKRLGARAGYALGVGVVLSLGAWLGVLALLKSLIPVAAVAPLLVFVALAIGAQAFTAVPSRHAPAVVLALIPHVADLVTHRIGGSLSAAAHYIRYGGVGAATAAPVSPTVAERLQELAGPDAALRLAPVLETLKGIHVAGQSMLSRGAIVTGLLWGAIVALLIDGRFGAAALFTAAAAGLTTIGILHEPGLALHASPMALGYGIWAAVSAGLWLRGRRAAEPGAERPLTPPPSREK